MGNEATGDPIIFIAALPATQTAIQRHGAGNGMRVTFDIPESEMAKALELITWTQINLEITIRPLPKETPIGSWR